MSASPAIGLEAAVPLLAALACRLAEQASIRALLIKGAPAVAGGVRSDRPSVDVDLWVDPERFDHYLGLIEDRGWTRYGVAATGVGWAHAVTMVHPDWPCTIDVHRRFPGLLADDEVVFDQVWRTRATSVVGRRSVAVPSRVASAAITVLHATRSVGCGQTDDDHACALAAAAGFTTAERGELDELATTTGSEEPLADLLAAAGCSARDTSPASARLAEWRLQVEVRSHTAAPWLLALRRSSWRTRIRLLGVAVRPTDLDYALAGASRTRRGAARATWTRFRRGTAALPAAWRAVHGR